MSKARRFDLYIQDILTSMQRILSYLDGHDFESFQKNFMVADAVVRNFEIIGEAAKKIPKEIQDRNPEIPWKKMYQLRNIVSHAYFEIDYETVWEIVTKQLPQNLHDMQNLLQKEFPDLR